MSRRGLALVTAIWALLPGVAQATLIYEFSGVIPVGAVLTHPSVSEGETWTATILVDDSVVADTTTPGYGIYDGAALSGTLAFSGGYSASFGSGRLLVADDAIANGQSVDAVQAFFSAGPELLLVQATTFDTFTLSSIALPLAGTSFASSPGQTVDPFYNLSYIGLAGSVGYLGDLANNTSFTATATDVVPEPGSLTLLALGLASLGFARRRTK